MDNNNETNRDYTSPRPWKVRRAAWGGYLIMDATGEAIASMDDPAPEVASANAEMIVWSVNMLSAPARNWDNICHFGKKGENQYLCPHYCRGYCTATIYASNPPQYRQCEFDGNGFVEVGKQ